MEIKLIGKHYQAKYTIGHSYVNNRFFSDYLEPPSLHLTERGVLGTILTAKYKGYRTILTGCHRILTTRSQRFGRWLLLLMNIKEFEEIRIHAGNKPEDTRGCILPGFNRCRGYAFDSIRRVLILVKVITGAIMKGEEVSMEVRQSPTHSLTLNLSSRREEGASLLALLRRERGVTSGISLKFYSKVKGGDCELCE